MPIGLKLFFILCAAIAAWFIWDAVSLLWFPSAEHLARIAGEPEGDRSLALAGDRFSAMAWTLQGAVLLAFAALIVFGRLGWMRYALAGLIVFQYAAPAASTLLRSGMPFARRWAIYTAGWWHSPANFVWLGIWILVIVLMFLPGAKRWLRQRSFA